MKRMILFLAFWMIGNLVYGQDKTPNEMLLEAMKGEDVTAIYNVINAGVDINLQDKQGNTALMWAAERDDWILFMQLMLKDANIELRNKKGDNVETIAKKNKSENILFCLENPQKGAFRFVCNTDNAETVSLIQEGKYDEALKNALKTKNYCLKGYNEEDSNYANALNNIADSYRNLGKYQKALPLYLKAIDIHKKSLGEQQSNYAIYLNNLAVLYESMGKYQKALPLFIKVKSIRQKVFGEQHPNYAVSLNNLAELYRKMGEYKKALPLFIKAKNIFKKGSKKQLNNYATCLHNLAELYRNLGEYEKVESLLIQSKNIRKKILSEQHPDYATSLNSLAGFYCNTCQYQKALPLLIQTNNIREKILGKQHPDYATSLNNLAAVYEKIGEYQKAISLYIKATDIYKNTLGKQHLKCVVPLNNLVKLYEKSGQYQKANPYLIQSLQIQQYNTIKHTSILSENAIINYSKKGQRNKKIAHSFNTRHPNHILSLESHNLHLLTKSLALQGSIDTKLAILTDKDNTLTQLYEDWKVLRFQIYNAHQMSITEREQKNIDLKQWQWQLDSLQEQLAMRSEPIKAQFEHRQEQVKHQDLAKTLQKGEASLDFVHFQYYNGKKWTDSIMYAAYLTLPNSKYPIFIPLREEKEIAALLEDEVGSDGEYSYIESTETGNQLYQLIFAPLENHLKGVNTLHISLSGMLHQVAFHALPTGKDKRLLDSYDIHYQGTLRDFVIACRKKKATSSPHPSIALFGNPHFNASLDNLVGSTVWDIDSTWVTRGNREGFDPLPETATEVEHISAFAHDKKWTVLLQQENDAREANVKALSGRNVGIIHLATHGYALAQKKERPKDGLSPMRNEERVTRQQNSLLRSGIVLAGGNTTWKSKERPTTGEDGLLTSYEISQMDLTQTNLVVLSACNSGRGDVLSGEGVFGLQRAFRNAGVRYLVVSLWEVDDTATRLLMEKFYGHYFQGKSPDTALKLAQAEMREGEWNAPEYWAGFVVVE